ncbi:hypothetical protein [Thermococcus aciditolerans]|uniref:DUF2254 domain-containing protein n=1 Tax=Thermococcus aciditolerans TaxID=2598455 RepID=A0A5C0SK58_9EURY|nr:hypothetical protein [Thermococcus aciditolerans]QEK14146.1 hypothetical protein FPV09_02345 [Thermococcus aciditolerans]
MKRVIRVIKEYKPLPSYILSIVISIEVFSIFLEFGFFQNISPEDTRYFLSALAQVEGAIIAIYITMMIVGIQLTIKDYSGAVIKVYHKNREFWLVVISYVALIILTLTLLQNGETLNSLWLHIVYLWGIFNLVILPLFIYDSFVLFNPEAVIDRFLKIHSLTIERTNNLWTIYKVASKSIQSQNVGATTYLLEKIRAYIRNDLLNRIKTIGRKIEESRAESLDLEEFQLMLAFIEGLTHMLRSLALYTIDQYNSKRISQDEATWILNMIEPIFRIIFADLVISVYPFYFVPEIKENLEYALSQCLLDLELIIEKLQEAPSEIKEELLGRFLDALPHDFVKSLKNAGYEHLAERAERLRELAREKEMNKGDFISI